MNNPLRVAVTAASVTILLLSAIGPGVAATPTNDPVEAAAGWLTTQLTDGQRITVQFGGDVFDSYGPTADVLLALAGAGVASGPIHATADWLDRPEQVAAYTGDGVDEIYAGATGKLLIVAAATGRDPTDLGERDLVSQLVGLRDDGGRFVDQSAFGEFSSTLTQAFAVLGLHRADPATRDDSEVAFMLDQQCGDGGFRFDPDAAGCTSHVDTTGMVVQALYAVGGPGPDAAADLAVDWLKSVQEEAGGFAGSAEPANANSTGLAALALSLGGADSEATAARDWILTTLQHDCDSDQPGAIQAMADEPGDLVLATTQALWGLSGVSLAAVTADGASDAVPLLDCEAPEVPVDDGDGGDDDDPDEVDSEVVEPADDVLPTGSVVPAGDVLPETGGERTRLGLVGFALLAAGILLLFATRRRPVLT